MCGPVNAERLDTPARLSKRCLEVSLGEFSKTNPGGLRWKVLGVGGVTCGSGDQEAVFPWASHCHKNALVISLEL